MCQRRILRKPNQSPRAKLLIPKIQRERYNSLGTTIVPKDLGGNVQTADKRLPSTVSDEALLLTDEELLEESEDDVFKAGDEMDENIHHTDEEELILPHQTKTILNHLMHKILNQTLTSLILKISRNMTMSCHSLKDDWYNIFKKYLRYFITDLQKISRKNIRMQLLYMLILRVKLRDFIMLLRMFIKALRLPSTHMRSSLSSFRLSMGLKSSVESLQASALRQDEHLAEWAKFEISSLKQDASEIKSMMTKIFKPFKDTATEEPHSHTEGKNDDMETQETEVEKELKKETTEEDYKSNNNNSNINLIDITPPEQPKSLPMAPKDDKGKGIATNETEEPTKKLVPVKIYQLTNDEIQAHLDKEKMIKKAVEEARLWAMSKPELIKVVHEEASNVGIDPKVLASAKGGPKFKNIQDVELKVLNIEHS
ncbi:hypothetical protein Tco_1458922 [Tanacetum coccineum]